MFVNRYKNGSLEYKVMAKINQIYGELKRVISVKRAIEVVDEYSDMRKEMKEKKVEKYLINKYDFIPTTFESWIYYKLTDISKGGSIDRFKNFMDDHHEEITLLHNEYKKVFAIADSKADEYYDELLKRELLRIASIDRARQLNMKDLQRELKPFLLVNKQTMSWDDIHEFYKHNVKSTKPVLSTTNKWQKEEKEQQPPTAENKEKRKRKPKKSEPTSWWAANFKDVSPWKSIMKVQDYGKRIGWDSLKIEEQTYRNGFVSFNMREQKKLMRHHVYPRYTFVLDYFFPGRFMYLLAINVNTRKAFFAIPDEVQKRGNVWYVPDNPKVSTVSAINSLKHLMSLTPVKGLIMDNEPAWQNVFHAFCNSQGIQWRHEHKNKFGDVVQTNEERRGNHSTTAIIDRLIRTLRTMNYNLGNKLDIDPETLQHLIDEYNNSPHSTLTRLLKRPTTPNEVNASVYLENRVVTELMKENLLTEMQDGYEVNGRVRVFNDASSFDKLKPKLLPGKWDVVGKKDGLIRLKQGENEILVNRWMIKT